MERKDIGSQDQQKAEHQYEMKNQQKMKNQEKQKQQDQNKQIIEQQEINEQDLVDKKQKKSANKKKENIQTGQSGFGGNMNQNSDQGRQNQAFNNVGQYQVVQIIEQQRQDLEPIGVISRTETRQPKGSLDLVPVLSKQQVQYLVDQLLQKVDNDVRIVVLTNQDQFTCPEQPTIPLQDDQPLPPPRPSAVDQFGRDLFSQRRFSINPEQNQEQFPPPSPIIQQQDLQEPARPPLTQTIEQLDQHSPLPPVQHVAAFNIRPQNPRTKKIINRGNRQNRAIMKAQRR